MKIKLILIAVLVMIICYFISGLFFLNAGIVVFDDGMDEVRAVKVFEELDKIPIINIPYENMSFSMYGTVTMRDGDLLTLEDRHKSVNFTYTGNVTDIEQGDKVWLRYSYTEEYEKEITKLKIKYTAEEVGGKEECSV